MDGLDFQATFFLIYFFFLCFYSEFVIRTFLFFFPVKLQVGAIGSLPIHTFWLFSVFSAVTALRSSRVCFILHDRHNRH